MDLGTTITRLRTQRGLSQGDLAEALEVSRQSVSKWETNASTPDLEKLVKLSRFFGVTLDELVTGDTPPAPEPAAAPPRKVSGRRIAGFIFLCIAVLVWLRNTPYSLPFALLDTAPFLICSGICFFSKRRTALFCIWSFYFCAEIYIRWTTQLTWRLILHTFSFSPEENYVRLAIAWGQFLVMLFVFGITLYSFRKTRFDLSIRRNCKLFIGGWVLLAALYAAGKLLASLWFTYKGPVFSYGFGLLVTFFHTSCLFLLLALLILTVCALRSLRNKPENPQ